MTAASALPPPGLYSIAPHRPFLEDLAAQALAGADTGGDPLALARMTVLLPTRRACRTLQEVFLRLTDGAPVVLPRLVPIGDVDEDEMLLSEAGGPLFESDARIPEGMPELRRRILLARLLQAHPPGGAQEMSIDHAVELAGELGRLLDQVQTERLDFAALENLVPEEYSAHWQDTLGLLAILTDAWPRILAAEQAIDPAERRNRLLEARAELWRASPPRDPVIAAGSTGAVPAAADLIAAVAELPAGYVVFPGLDRVLDDDEWSGLEPSHPQSGLRRLLDRLGADRDQVREWPAASKGVPAGPAPSRVRLLAEALRPANTTEAWRGRRGEIGADALDGVMRIDAREPHEEAGAIALALREVLETPGRTGALVTLDRGLARRVASILGRWDVEIDDSAGTPLAETPPGVFMRLCAAMAHEGAAPVPLLAALKHPLAAGGRSPGAFRAAARELERFVLRGPRPAPGLAGLRAAADAIAERIASRDGTYYEALRADGRAELPDGAADGASARLPGTPPGGVSGSSPGGVPYGAQEADGHAEFPGGAADGMPDGASARSPGTPSGGMSARASGGRPGGVMAALARIRKTIALLAELAGPMEELLHGPPAPLRTYVRAHIAMCEALAESDAETGAARLWAGDAGEALAAFVSELLEAGDALGAVEGARYPALFEALLAGRVVRPLRGAHPRLSILGPLEARLQRFDLVVLGGLNEGVWPPAADVDPWMSRQMRGDFGLPPPERRIGLSAHDFVQAFCAGTVALTRSERAEGAPTLPSRWLKRLEVAGEALGVAPPPEMRRRARNYLHWRRELDGPPPGAAPDPAAQRPRPAPPVESRPRQLSVTRIETWMRDPYAIYAYEILRLRALPPLDQDADAAIYGSLIHRILDSFLADLPRCPLPRNARRRLLARGRAAFAPWRAAPAIWAFWWPRFERIADWFLSVEAERRERIARTHTEVGGGIEFAAPAGPFRLTARADRIDEFHDGSVGVIDFKTGAPPGVREVMAGFAPQLPLEAAIAAQGGFDGIAAKEIGELAFWRLSGGREAGKVSDAVDGDPALAAAAALDGLRALVARFDDAATAYEARPRPDRAPAYSDYEHLARVKEWSSGGGAPDGGEA